MAHTHAFMTHGHEYMIHITVPMTHTHVPMTHSYAATTHIHVSWQALVGGLSVLIRLVVGLAGPQLLPGRAGSYGECPVHEAQLQLPHAVPALVNLDRAGCLRITDAVARSRASRARQAEATSSTH